MVQRVPSLTIHQHCRRGDQWSPTHPFNRRGAQCAPLRFLLSALNISAPHFLRRSQTYTPALRFAFRQDCWYNKYIPSGRLCGQERSPLWKHLTRAQPCFICPVCLNFMTCMRRFCRFIVRIGSIFTTGAPSARSTAHRLTAYGRADGSSTVTAPHARLSLIHI